MNGETIIDINEDDPERDWYDYISPPNQNFIEYNNAETYLTFLILARKWLHQNGTSSNTGLYWEDVHIFLKYNYKKKKRKKLFNDILLIEYGGLQAENKQLAENRK